MCIRDSSEGDREAGREEGGGELTGEGGSSAMHRCFFLRGPWPDPAPSPAAGGPHGRGDDPGSVPHASTVGASRLAAGAPAPVSYTHLTLPTIFRVSVSLG